MAGSRVIQRNLDPDVFQFSEKHGQNVRLANGKTSALWFQRCFDGKCFVTEPLSRGGRLTLELSGSGALLFGLLNRRPTKSEVRDVENKLSPNCVYLQQYDMHKKKFTVSLSRETSREVKLKSDVDTKTLEMKNGGIFLAFELLYGDFVMELLSDDGRNYKFDAVCGPNIQYPSRSCKSVCLQNPYGDALCSASRALGRRETIHLIFNPVDEAKWCHMITYLSNRSPAMTDVNNMEMGLKSRMKFKLRGSVQLCFQDGGVPSYAFNGRKKRTDVGDLDLSAPLFLYMQLFRVRVDLHTARPRCVSDGADNRSGDRPITRESSRSVIDGAGASGRLMTKKSFSDLIQSKYVYLKDFLEPDPLADHLLANHKMSPIQAEEFLELPTRRKKCEIVLHILMKDPNTEETFIRAMEYPQHPQKHILIELGLLEGDSSSDCDT